MESDAPAGVRAAMEAGEFGGFGRAGVREELQSVFANWPLAVDCLQAAPDDQVFERRLGETSRIEWKTNVGSLCGVFLDSVLGAAHPSSVFLTPT